MEALIKFDRNDKKNSYIKQTSCPGSLKNEEHIVELRQTQNVEHTQQAKMTQQDPEPQTETTAFINIEKTRIFNSPSSNEITIQLKKDWTINSFNSYVIYPTVEI